MAESTTARAVPTTPRIVNLRFEHHPFPGHLGTHMRRPRLSWGFADTPGGFVQHGYEMELYDKRPADGVGYTHRTEVISGQNILVSWPFPNQLQPRQQLFVRVRAWNKDGDVKTAWSDAASIEGGLLGREEWKAHLISSPWDYPKDSPQPEELFRKQFQADPAKPILSARLYITVQGVYQAEINGRVVGDHVLSPGWTVYDRRLRYQCFDVLEHLCASPGTNTIGVRLAEGWFCGRLGWGGGHRNIWGERPALLAQLEIVYADSDRSMDVITTDSSWVVTKGPTVTAELYHGEKYDARLEIAGWSGSPDGTAVSIPQDTWQSVTVCEPLPSEILLIAEEAEPVRRITTLQPQEIITTPSGKTILDFGQNLVGYTRLKNIHGPRGTTISLAHAEVLEHGELGRRPLRVADNLDQYTLSGNSAGESWEPRFTFHGFRYVEVSGWPKDASKDRLLSAVEAVVCHTDMKRIGHFSCSDSLLTRFHDNVVWGMRGNFLSIPTDCPQRDERLGWTGDLAMFAPTAALLHDCAGMLREWLRDVFLEQGKHGGVPPLVVPNALGKDPIFGRVMPAAVWADVVVLAPWALYQATGDVEILSERYQSMLDWIASIPRNSSGNCHLWDTSNPQLGVRIFPSLAPGILKNKTND